MASERLTCSAIVFMTAAFIGCASQLQHDVYHRLDLPAQSDSRGPRLDAEQVKQLKQQLRSGDIILGVKEDAITAVVRLLTIEPSYFTHSGTLEVIADSRGQPVVRVWHAIGDFSLLHRSPHVLGKVRGGVRTIALERFIDRYDTVKIIRLGDSQQSAASVEVCRELMMQGVPFDPFADCLDDSSICCTELTAIAIVRSGMVDALEPLQRTGDPSLSAFLESWNVTTQAIFTADQFERLPGARSIATISKYSRMDMYAAMRDAVRLIHEQVASGTLAAGDLGGFDSKRMAHFQPRMTLFLRGVEGLARASPTMDDSEIRRRNRIVLEAVFGVRADEPG